MIELAIPAVLPEEDVSIEAIAETHEESLRALTAVVRLLGYPDEYAIHLEQTSFERGKLWRQRVAGDTDAER